ncbi:MAG: putative lipid II flippase FtsW [bacterium]
MKIFKEIDLSLLLATAVLLVVGLLMVFSSSAMNAFREFSNEFYFFQRQIIWSVLSITALVVTASIPVEVLKKLIPLGYVLIIITLLLVLVPFIGHESGGARRWLNVGIIGFQPSEFAKVAVIAVCALYLTKEKLEQKNIVRDMFVVCLLVMSLAFLIILQPDAGTAFQVALLGLVMMLLAGFPYHYLFSLMALGMPLAGAAIFISDYRRARLISYLNPWGDPFDRGYHAIQTLRALSRGGLLGEGLGESMMKRGYLPEPFTDSIIAVLGEEIGFIGLLFVITLLLVVIIRGFMISLQSPNSFDRMLGVGLVFLIGFQSALNLSVVGGLIPTTGVPMPLISYGGSSLLVNMIGIGLLLNISRRVSS